jgi:IS30 family transposase
MKQEKVEKKEKTKNTHFLYEERVKIECLLSEGYGTNKIARKIDRSKSSVSHEINHNSVHGVYTAKKAHLKAYQRRWRAKLQCMKVVLNSILRNYVESSIKKYWSPEAIAGRIKYVEIGIPYANKDSIYKYVKSPYGRQLEEYLWYQGNSHQSTTKRSDLENRTFIDQRPITVEKRHFFWDWEGDFIVSGKDGSGALLVLVERKSRYVLIFKLDDRKVETINAVLRLVFGSGQLVANSLTIDNDICFKHHPQMSKIIGAPIFFCHPYHSWEKGQVEKMNQLIRRFIKKGSDISKVSEQKVRWVQNILNNKPLKCLGFYTPNEVLLRSSRLKKFVQKNTAREVLTEISNLSKCSV